jgi:hypothetical protein
VKIVERDAKLIPLTHIYDLIKYNENILEHYVPLINVREYRRWN